MHSPYRLRLSATWHRCRLGFILLIAVVCLVISAPGFAQSEISPIEPFTLEQQDAIENRLSGFPVMLDGEVLLRIRQGIPGVVTAEERATVINNRLTQIASDPGISLASLQVDEQANASVIRVGETVLFTVRDDDVIGTGQSRQELAAQTVEKVKAAVGEYREERSFRSLVTGVVLAVLGTIALWVTLRLIQQITSKLVHRTRVAGAADTLGMRVQNFQILNSKVIGYVLEGCLRLIRLALILSVLYLYIPFILSQFPTTRTIGQQIFSDIAAKGSLLAQALLQYLPNLAIIVVIILITYYITGFAKLVIIELGRDDAYPWFYPEWIRPTIRLSTFLIIAIACVIASPYLPGFGSPAFQGVSLFLGALFTLGSSSAIANAISGVILIYTRAFRIGDVIQIGDLRGEVLEKSLFVTRIQSFRREVITIPNSTVLSGNVVNFSAIIRAPEGQLLLLHTTVTLGYDVPWREIHETLIKAAEATKHVSSDPAPFVLQTGLNDFNVSYELNAYTDRPQLMPRIYSELHQNIQDYCNQVGIEILSPTYSSLRDGNDSTIPTDYLPSDYVSPSFRIQSQDHHPDHHQAK